MLLQKRNEIIYKKGNNCNERYKKIWREIELLEKQLKDKNLIFHGLSLNSKCDPGIVVQRIFQDILKIQDDDITTVHPINETKTSAKVCFSTVNATRDILRKGKLLKNTRISIHNDLPHIMSKRKSAILEVWKSINLIKANLKLKLKEDMLYINNILFNWDLNTNCLYHDEEGNTILIDKFEFDINNCLSKLKIKFDNNK